MARPLVTSSGATHCPQFVRPSEIESRRVRRWCAIKQAQKRPRTGRRAALTCWSADARASQLKLDQRSVMSRSCDDVPFLRLSDVPFLKRNNACVRSVQLRCHKKKGR